MTHQNLGSEAPKRNPRGTGSIYKVVKNGKEQFCAQYSLFEDGKRRYIRGFGNTENEALQAKAKAIERRFTNPVKIVRGKTILEALDLWLGMRGQQLSEQSRRKYRRDIEHHVIAHIGNKRIRALQRDELTMLFHETLPELEVGPSAIYHSFNNFNALLNWCVKEDLLEKNPMDRVERRKKMTAVLREDREHIDKRTRLFKEVREELSKNGDPKTFAIFLLLGVGLRRSELLGLEWRHVPIKETGQAKLRVEQQLARYETHEEKSGYYIRHSTKTGVDRKIPLSESTKRALRAYREVQTPGEGKWKEMVFTNDKGANMTYKDLQTIWVDVWKAKLKDKFERDYFRIHYTRHIAASMLIEKTNGNIQVAQQILGHQDELMTQHYSHLTQRAAKLALEAFEDDFDF